MISATLLRSDLTRGISRSELPELIVLNRLLPTWCCKEAVASTHHQNELRHPGEGFAAPYDRSAKKLLQQIG